jgi:NCAIR mutase (PurE)-related protein
VKDGKVKVPGAMERLKKLPFEDLDFATVDTHRSLRQGFPEVIYGEGKSTLQIKKIAQAMVKHKENVLITRIDKKKAQALKRTFKKVEYNETARTLFIKTHKIEKTGRGTILIISAGTSDVPVAEEAAITAECMGNTVERLYDVGVAGIHRLMHRKDTLFSANVLIVVAGMEGALPSVVAGLVARPVVAVPTSVGYGANLGGLTTLLAMLNSCAGGISVVNIDNGFGAAVVASRINSD